MVVIVLVDQIVMLVSSSFLLGFYFVYSEFLSLLSDDLGIFDTMNV